MMTRHQTSQLELRTVQAAEASTLQAERAVDVAIASTALSALALLALMVTIVQGRAALRRAREANQIASDSSEKQLRAYLSVEPQGVQIPDEGWISVPIDITNHGTTPASEIEVAGDVLLIGGDPREFNPEELGRLKGLSLTSDTMIGPGANRFHFAKVSDAFLDGHVDRVKNKESAIIHYGSIRYKDIFGRKRCTNFAFYHWGEELSDVESKRCRFGNNAT